MTGNDVLAAVRNRVADTDALNCTDEFILENINGAIEYLSKALIHRGAPCMVDTKKIIDYTHCPSGFHSFVGQPPLYLEGDIIRSYYGRDKSVNMRYFRLKDKIDSLDDVVPFEEDYKEELVTYASMLCLNKDEFSTDFEQLIMSNLTECDPGNTATTTTTSTSGSSS